MFPNRLSKCPNNFKVHYIVKYIITWKFLSINLLGCAETEHLMCQFKKTIAFFEHGSIPIITETVPYLVP